MKCRMFPYVSVMILGPEQQSWHSGPPASPVASPVASPSNRRVVKVNVVKRLGGSAIGHRWPQVATSYQRHSTGLRRDYVILEGRLLKQLDWKEREEKGQRYYEAVDWDLGRCWNLPTTFPKASRDADEKGSGRFAK